MTRAAATFQPAEIAPARRRGFLNAWPALAAIAAALIVSGLSPALSRAPSEQEKAAIAGAVQDFEAAFRRSDYESVLRLSMPPRLLAAFAANFGLPADQTQKLEAEIIGAMKTALSQIKLESFGMDVDKAEYRLRSDGAVYALIPTTTVIAAGGRRISAKGHTLAFMDDGKWWLLRIDQQQLPLLLKAYPQFNGVTFPTDKMEILN